jgi:glycosyltransferase involved in cell wall biosynthesis
MALNFDRTVARRHLRGARLVYGFEYTARETFARAKAEGIARVLAMPSLDSKEFEVIKSREESRFPELVTKHHGYFARRFPARYERRRAELELADLVVANSELTRRSHVRAGVHPDKIVAVPLAAPPPIEAVEPSSRSAKGPLSVVWAGNFSVGKGAPHFLDAWRNLRAGSRARAVVYGRNALPERVLRPLPESLILAGFVPQQELFTAFSRADILAFPTLADGFGAVVLEAFSRGLPVITTESAGASEFVEHRKNGLIIPAADSAALTDALQWCLDNREELYQMRFAALDTARRWQWKDYRTALVTKIGEHLGSTGLTAKDHST